MQVANKTTERDFASAPEIDSGDVAWRLVDASPEVATPAYLFDLDQMASTARRLSDVCHRADVRLLYSIKALPLAAAVRTIAHHVDGLAASSHFESRLARQLLDEVQVPTGKSLHLTTPGLRPDQIDSVAELCDTVALNSLSQWHRFGPQLAGRVAIGLRINPQLSVLSDDRYDPCRPHSKLGIPLDQLDQTVQNELARAGRLAGIHLHTSYNASSLSPLRRTVEHLLDRCSTLLDHVDWVNLGGGYRLDEIGDIKPLAWSADALRSKHGVDVMIEPGAALVRGGGTLVTTVIDRFQSDGRTVAVLDTSVNHLPLVFEYQTRPTLHDESPDGSHRVILAGCTCLAGDLFGEYTFTTVPEIGTKLLFTDVGAYALSKSHWLNGVNLPTTYTHQGTDRLTQVNETTYHDFAARCGYDASPQPL